MQKGWLLVHRQCNFTVKSKVLRDKVITKLLSVMTFSNFCALVSWFSTANEAIPTQRLQRKAAGFRQKPAAFRY